MKRNAAPGSAIYLSIYLSIRDIRTAATAASGANAAMHPSATAASGANRRLNAAMHPLYCIGAIARAQE